MNTMRALLIATSVLVAALSTAPASSRAALDFGAYYTRLNTGQPWEAYSRTDEYADVVVQLAKPAGKIVFWRGNSYLPLWETIRGRWNFDELIPRHGDGSGAMPDRANVYAHAEVVENTTSHVMIHWRYLPTFVGGNPHGGVDPHHFVDEYFTVTPDGQVTRLIKQGTANIDQWNDPTNQTVQVLQLNESGINRVSQIDPSLSRVSERVSGNPIEGPPVLTPKVWFKFDEGVGDRTKEQITQTEVSIPGDKVFWKRGVSGTAIEFDGYHTVVSMPSTKAPKLFGGSLTLEGWFALAAYPWNWVPIVQQGDNDGYFLGIDSHGYPGFMLKVDGAWQQLSVPNKSPFSDPNHLSLFRWYHIAGTYDKADGTMHLYIDGILIGSKSLARGGAQTVDADIRIGKAGILRKPTEGVNNNLPSDYGLDGLIDEVRIYNSALSPKQVADSFQNFQPNASIVHAPDMQKRAFPKPGRDRQFSAAYTHLPYYETWDSLWRFGPYPDVVVSFDQLPIHYVFWRGVSFVPIMVNESGQWYTNEFNETGFTKNAPGDCEPMSDKACYDSHVRIIENSPARVVIHWRYRLANPEHHWANYDEATGWGDIADWYYTIYPDGVACKRMRCYTSEPKTWHEWDEQIVVLGEGQKPDEVIGQKPVMTLVDNKGREFNYGWISAPPKPDYRGRKIIQEIHLTGSFSPFTIQAFTGGDIYTGQRWHSITPWWNHWPTAQINSSGRNASFPDRASHSSISHLFWNISNLENGKMPFMEKNLLEGMTNQGAVSQLELAKSWLSAPAVSQVSGGASHGYDPSQRAYVFAKTDQKLQFVIDASEVQPIHNLCFVTKAWPGRASAAKLAVNNVAQSPGPDFRQGVTIDTDGSYTLIVWLRLSARSPERFEISTAQ
jgi:hypothetical protein